MAGGTRETPAVGVSTVVGVSAIGVPLPGGYGDTARYVPRPRRVEAHAEYFGLWPKCIEASRYALWDIDNQKVKMSRSRPNTTDIKAISLTAVVAHVATVKGDIPRVIGRREMCGR